MKKLFEPITNAQIKKIHARAREIKLPDEKLYSMIKRLIGIPTITALSRQEAGNIIEKLMGPTKWLRPPPARTADEIEGDSSDLAYWRHVDVIRRIVKALEWDKEHLKSWLLKYMKVRTIRELNRERGRDAFVAMKAVQDHQLKKAA